VVDVLGDTPDRRIRLPVKMTSWKFAKLSTKSRSDLVNPFRPTVVHDGGRSVAGYLLVDFASARFPRAPGDEIRKASPPVQPRTGTSLGGLNLFTKIEFCGIDL
jgi:hypothetical protein